MTKRKSAATNEPVSKKPVTGYELVSWRGAPLYQCAQCAYNSFSQSEIALHIYQRHVLGITTYQPEEPGEITPDNGIMEDRDD